jgi:hypothetical protein
VWNKSPVPAVTVRNSDWKPIKPRAGMTMPFPGLLLSYRRLPG